MTDVEDLRPDREYWKFLWKSACKRAEEWEAAWSQMEAERDALQAQVDTLRDDWAGQILPVAIERDEARKERDALRAQRPGGHAAASRHQRCGRACNH